MIHFPQAPKSVCIFLLSAIGDATHVIPIIHSLKQAWPETEITWIIDQPAYQLVQSLSGVKFILFHKADGWRAYTKLYQQLRGIRFDLLLMMQAAIRASIASLLIPAQYKLGFDRQRAADCQYLFSNCRIQGRARVHVLESLFQFLEMLGIENRVYSWQLPLPATEVLRCLQLPEVETYVIINPCSSVRRNNWRNWPSNRYAEIADYLSSKKIQVILTGGPSPAEAAFGQSILQQCRSSIVNLIGQTSLQQLLLLLKGAHFLIAPDTGPAHMATIVDTPVVGLFASSNPAHTGPYKSQQTLVNCYPAALQQFNHKSIESASWGERVRNPEVMSLITVDDVKHSIDQLLPH